MFRNRLKLGESATVAAQGDGTLQGGSKQKPVDLMVYDLQFDDVTTSEVAGIS